MTEALKVGDRVHCIAGNIDKGRGVGAVGYITGFARFSSYHPREVFVSDRPEGNSDQQWCGWFWESSVKRLED